MPWDSQHGGRGIRVAIEGLGVDLQATKSPYSGPRFKATEHEQGSVTSAARLSLKMGQGGEH
jgi:hypothetical protein